MGAQSSGFVGLAACLVGLVGLCNCAGQHETCPSKNGQTCTVTLDHDERVEVFPISVPPPPGP